MTDTDQELVELAKASNLYERYLRLAELAVEALPEPEGEPAEGLVPRVPVRLRVLMARCNAPMPAYVDGCPLRINHGSRHRARSG